jgi:hypothetical protein
MNLFEKALKYFCKVPSHLYHWSDWPSSLKIDLKTAPVAIDIF